jgi:hypothetical protein
MWIALATTKKNQLSVSNYYAKMSAYADELAASGTPLRDDEFVAYLLAGLDEEYNHVFTAVVAQVDPIKPRELFSQLLNFENHTNLQVRASAGGAPSTMAASRGHGFFGGRGSGPSNWGSQRQDLNANYAKRLATLPRLAGIVTMMTALNSALPPWLLMAVTMRGTRTPAWLTT